MKETKTTMSWREFSDLCKASGGAWRPGNAYAFAHTRIALGAEGKFLTRYNRNTPQTRLAATPGNLEALLRP